MYKSVEGTDQPIFSFKDGHYHSNGAKGSHEPTRVKLSDIKRSAAASEKVTTRPTANTRTEQPKNPNRQQKYESSQ